MGGPVCRLDKGKQKHFKKLDWLYNFTGRGFLIFTPIEDFSPYDSLEDTDQIGPRLIFNYKFEYETKADSGGWYCAQAPAAGQNYVLEKHYTILTIYAMQENTE